MKFSNGAALLFFSFVVVVVVVVVVVDGHRHSPIVGTSNYIRSSNTVAATITATHDIHDKLNLKDKVRNKIRDNNSYHEDRGSGPYERQHHVSSSQGRRLQEEDEEEDQQQQDQQQDQADQGQGSDNNNNNNNNAENEDAQDNQEEEKAEGDEDGTTTTEYIQATSCTAFTVEPELDNDDMSANTLDSILKWAQIETYHITEQSYIFYQYDYDGDLIFDANYIVDLESWMEALAYAYGGYDYGCRELEDAYDLFGSDDEDLIALANIDVAAYSEATGDESAANNMDGQMDKIYVGSVCGLDNTSVRRNGGFLNGNNEGKILDGVFLDSECSTFVPSLTYKYRELLKSGAATSYDLPTAVSIMTDYALDCDKLGSCEDLLDASVNADTCTTYEEDIQMVEEAADAAEQDQEQEQEQEEAAAADAENGGGRRSRKLEDANVDANANDDANANANGDDGQQANADEVPEDSYVWEESSYQISQNDLDQGLTAVCSSIQSALGAGTTLQTVLGEHGQLPKSTGLSKMGIGLVVGAVLFVLILCILTVKIRRVPRKRRQRQRQRAASKKDSKQEPLVSGSENDDDDNLNHPQIKKDIVDDDNRSNSSTRTSEDGTVEADDRSTSSKAIVSPPVDSKVDEEEGTGTDTDKADKTE